VQLSFFDKENHHQPMYLDDFSHDFQVPNPNLVGSFSTCGAPSATDLDTPGRKGPQESHEYSHQLGNMAIAMKIP
jgi:hypothetical protein